MAKRIQLSADDVTYYTLPGNTGEQSDEAAQLPDTIFGQPFESSQPGLITGSISSNALYKGFAGYVIKIEKTGAAIVMTDEAMSLVSGKTYIITATAKQVIDPATAIVVEDNSVNQNANVESINFLTGEVTFKSAYTVTGPVTITGAYLPRTEVAGSRAFTLTQTANAIDNTDIPTARTNDGIRTYEAGLRTVSLELQSVFKTSNGFKAALRARTALVISLNPDNADLSVARGMFKYTGQSQSGDVGDLEEESITLALNVPDEPATGIPWTYPFGWRHSALTKLSQAVRIALAAWQDEDSVYFKYLHDGTNGYQGEGIITDVSLTGGLEAMNEFTVNIQISGATTAVP